MVRPSLKGMETRLERLEEAKAFRERLRPVELTDMEVGRRLLWLLVGGTDDDYAFAHGWLERLANVKTSEA